MVARGGDMTAIVSMFRGPAMLVEDVSRPTFAAHAERYGLVLLDAEHRPGLHVDFAKVAALRAALDAGHEVACWIDADAVLLDEAPSLATVIEPGDSAACGFDQRFGPTSCLLAVRNDDRARALLDRLETIARPEPTIDGRDLADALLATFGDSLDGMTLYATGDGGEALRARGLIHGGDQIGSWWKKRLWLIGVRQRGRVVL